MTAVHFLAPRWGARSFAIDYRGCSLRSTPGYFLATLRVECNGGS